MSIIELAGRIKEATYSDSEIVFIPYDEAYGEGFEDMPRRVPDTSKLERAVGWRPHASLHEILDEVIQHERTRTKLPVLMPSSRLQGSPGETLHAHRR